MKKLYKLAFLTLVGLGLSAVSSFGQITFDYSYTFASQDQIFGGYDTVYGQFTGTFAGGGLVDIDTILSVYLNGTAVGLNADTGPYVVASATPFLGSPAVASFNALDNNFVIIDSNLNGFAMTPYYDIINNPPGGAEAVITVDGDILDQDAPTDPCDWSLSVAPCAVPEPTTVIAGAAMLLPFGLSTLRMLRKSKKA